MQHYWKIFNEFVCFSRGLSSEYPSVCRTFKTFSPSTSHLRSFSSKKNGYNSICSSFAKKQSFALGKKGHLKNLSNCIMEISHCILNGSIFLFFFYCLPNTIRLSANYIIEPKNCSKVSNIHTYEFLGRLSNTPLTP